MKYYIRDANTGQPSLVDVVSSQDAEELMRLVGADVTASIEHRDVRKHLINETLADGTHILTGIEYVLTPGDRLLISNTLCQVESKKGRCRYELGYTTLPSGQGEFVPETVPFLIDGELMVGPQIINYQPPLEVDYNPNKYVTMRVTCDEEITITIGYSGWLY